MLAFLAQLLIGILGIFIASFSVYLIGHNIPQDTGVTRYFDPHLHKFNDPAIAYHLLKLLDSSNLTPNSYCASPTIENLGTCTESLWRMMPVDGEYCNKHRAYFVRNTERSFTSQSIMTDALDSNLTKNSSFSRIEKDLESSIRPNTGHLISIRDLPLTATNIQHFFTMELLHSYLNVGQDFACLTQTYNHILSTNPILQKELEPNMIGKYIKRYKNKPHCLKYNTLFPREWRLFDLDDCKVFFSELNNGHYIHFPTSDQVLYLKVNKKDPQSKKNFFVLDLNEDKHIKELYENGKRCGEQLESHQHIIQSYVSNPLLIDIYHFSLRAYLLIASVNPLIAYYHDGFVKVSLAETDLYPNGHPVTSIIPDKEDELSNISINNPLIDQILMRRSQFPQQWTFKQFTKYLLDGRHITNFAWIDEHLRFELKKAMIHLLRMSQNSFIKSSSVYELFGIDFMIDYKFDLWVADYVQNPMSEFGDPELKYMIKRMLKDHFEIVVGLTRSRIKRVIDFVNSLTKEVETDNIFEGKIYLRDLERRRREFDHLIQNKWEEEFIVSKKNRFQLIIDENYHNEERYSGLFPPDCFHSPFLF